MSRNQATSYHCGSKESAKLMEFRYNTCCDSVGVPSTAIKESRLEV